MKASRLLFKGDSKPYRRKKKTIVETPKSEIPSGWIQAKTIISGPCMIISSFPFGLAALAVDPQFKLYWIPLNLNDPIEPTQVNQVFVLKQILDSKQILLKSCFDRHLGIDSNGSVECDKEAAGMNHQWEIIKDSECKFSFKSFLGSFLTVDFALDSDNFKKAKLKSDSCKSKNSCFSIYIQASSFISTTAKKEVDWVEIEAEKLKSSHGHTLGKVKLYKDLGSGLSESIKKGNVNETLLERRSKMKSDKVFYLYNISFVEFK